MRFRHYGKFCAVGLSALLIQACASTPSAPQQKTDGHIKTELPAPFPVTPESLRKEREMEQKMEQKLGRANATKSTPTQ